MNNNLKTIQKVVEIAEKRRKDALLLLGQQQREWQIANEQMLQLEAYSQEAEQRWEMRSGVGVDAAMLHHHRHFMQKIQHAIEFQRGVMRERQERVDHGQAQVFAAERDVAGLRKFAERKEQAFQLSAQRQEQKATDEMALNIHLRQRLSQPSRGLNA
ncbi:MAG: flagellar export protein FliJ [Hydrogenophaga sp.]